MLVYGRGNAMEEEFPLYETIQRPLNDEEAFKVCEILGLDPNRVHKLILDSAPLQSELTIVQLPEKVKELER